MKRIGFIVVMLGVFCIAASADEWINFNESESSVPIYDVTNSTNSIVEFELVIPGMNSKDVDYYNRVYIPEHSRIDSVGYPEVPFVSYLVAIPECDNVNLNISVIDSVVIDDMNIYPAPEWVEVNNGDVTYLEEQFSINTSFYQSDEYFPGYAGELVEKGAVRDQYCIRIKVYPVQFNPAQQQVIAYSRLNIEMTFDNAVGSVNNDVGIFNEVCSKAMINYISNGMNASVSCESNREGSVSWIEDPVNELAGDYINPVCDYLIITHEDFYTDLEAKEQVELLAQKRATYNGFDVIIVKYVDIVNYIQGIYPDEKMRNLIQNTYNINGVGNAQNTFDGRLGYVLLFGDANFGNDVTDDCVPTHPYQNQPTASGYDVYFSQLTTMLNGTPDVYPDVLLGRIPADDSDDFIQVTNVCTKMIDYEPINVNDPEYDGWKDRMTLLAGPVGAQDLWPYTVNGFNMISQYIESYDTTLLTESSHYTYFPYFDFYNYYSPENLVSQHANGNSIVIYSGHGANPGWYWPITPYPYHFWYSDFANTYPQYNIEDRLPFVISASCLTGAFQAQEVCMAEEYLSADLSKGSIGFIGASEEVNARVCDTFFPYCFEAFDADLTTCGEMLILAKLKTTNQDFRNQVNLFGDPALNIILDSDEIQLCDLVCSPIDIAEPENINNQTLIITAGVQNLSNVNVENVDVKCILKNEYMNTTLEEIIQIDYIEGMETGSAVFNFDINTLYPADLVIEIFADPHNLIEERSENNNSTTKSYKFFREQINFPVYINYEAINGNMPLWFDNSIIVSGKKIDNMGNPIWNWNTTNESKSLFVPLYDFGEDCYNFVVIIHCEGSGDGISLVNGQNGSTIDDYILPAGYEISNICVDDLTNDGNYEIVISSTTGDNSCITILDDELTVMQSIDTISGKIKIAVADGNNNGIKEIFSLDIDAQRLTVYEYDNGNNLFYSINSRDFNISVEGLCLMDHYDSGVLNCVVYSYESEFMIILPANNINNPEAQVIQLRSALNNIAIGDIDNNGDDEIVLLSDDNRIKVIDSGVVNILFSISNEIYRTGSLLLYDLDYNNLPEMIIYDNNEIYAYYQNGDSIFKFPLISTSTPIIFDIDMDGDIEILNLIKSSDDGLTGLNVSDLPNLVSNHGNLYPKMNELCNNLYSQPVSGQLAADANYYWSGSITLHNEVTLPSTSTLTIMPGTIIKAKENSKLTAYGDVHINGTENQPVKFIPAITGASQNYWQGLKFPEGNTCAELNYMNIENGSVTAERNLTIDCGSFVNTPLTVNGSSLNASNVEFNNSPILAELYGIHAQSEIISINYCSITNLSQDPGIEMTGYPNVYLANNTISNCLSGIKIWESGSGVTHSLNNNYIANNTEYGLFIYHSNIDIEGSNLLANNNEGMFVTHDSNFSMIGSEDYPLQTVHDNLRHEVRFTYDSRPSEFYHNCIYDDNHEYNYLKCELGMEEPAEMNISNNYWGSSFNPETDLSPLEYLSYLPIWYPGVPDEKESSNDEELFLTALTAEDSSEYEVAEQTYEQVISLYPASEYSVMSAKKLFDLKVKYDQDFYDLKLYYETEPNMQYNDELSGLAEFLITFCNVKLEEFEPAINWFEDIIQNPPTIVDSVFAVIDAGYTYLVMGNSRSSYSGRISELKPKSKKQYAVKRDELIDLLFGDSEPENEIPQVYKLKLFPNYPNPFNPETTISFSIPEDCKVGITIYNIKGQKVKKLLYGDLEKGLHDVVWNSKDNSGKSVASGVYFYKFEVNGKSKGLKKMLLLK